MDDPRGPRNLGAGDATEPVPTVTSGGPTSLLPEVPAAVGSGVPVAWVRSAPLWAKIAVPVAALIAIGGIAGGGASNKKAAATAPKATVHSTTTTTEASTTTKATTTSEAPTTVAPTTVAPTTAPAATTPPATHPPATHPPATAPPPASLPATQGGPADPGDTKNCSDFASYSQAKAWFDTYFARYGDVAGLDADHDGIPCESLPGAP
jgi:Excalibur calcium-binding domain